MAWPGLLQRGVVRNGQILEVSDFDGGLCHGVWKKRSQGSSYLEAKEKKLTTQQMLKRLLRCNIQPRFVKSSLENEKKNQSLKTISKNIMFFLSIRCSLTGVR